MKYLNVLILALLLSIAASAQKTKQDYFPDSQLITVGAYYYPEHWPQDQWKRDLGKMADMGFEFTHFGEFAWAFEEPEEGKFNFDWLDKAVKIAGEKGLKVIMCTPTP
ncbi:MAG TPA: beta-galactosidase, partial [Sunxiuqinia sp.]|nr:beta-galactosidase [Sunxiuqinia sp.]